MMCDACCLMTVAMLLLVTDVFGSQGCLSKDALLQMVLGLKERLRESEEQWKALPKQKTEWTAELSQWLSRLRLNGLTLSPVKGTIIYTCCALLLQ